MRHRAPRLPATTGARSREQADVGLAFIDSLLPEHTEVARSDRAIASYDGAEITVRWYDPAPDHASLPCPARRSCSCTAAA